MEISRKLAIQILKYLYVHKSFYFPFVIVCKEYSGEDDHFVEIEPEEWENIKDDEIYQTFQLWENLQNLDEKTLKLMSKGFLEKISEQSLEFKINCLARNYRKHYKENLWDSKDSEDYGLNEFLSGKAEAYEDCSRMIKELF